MTPVAAVSSLPEGSYKVVSLAVDLTGKKPHDEICQIGAYCVPDKSFSQYVMPYRDVSRSATRTHGVRVFTNFGRFRVLKDTKSMKTLKTKSAYSTLTDFLDWLSEVKGSSDGVVMVYHDNDLHNVVPFLLHTLDQYKMTDMFFEIVKVFVNCCAVASTLPEIKDHSMSLRSLLRLSLELEDEKLTDGSLRSAKKRAELTYQLLAKMLKINGEIPSNDLKSFCTTRKDQLEICEKQRELASKVNSLRPIFHTRIREGPKERSRAVLLRLYLIQIATDYDVLKSAYESGGEDDIIKIVESTGASKKKKDAEELVQLIVAHFKSGGDMGKGKPDVNGNLKKEMGQGEPAGGEDKDSSSTESDDEEFEEANDHETTGSILN